MTIISVAAVVDSNDTSLIQGLISCNLSEKLSLEDSYKYLPDTLASKFAWLKAMCFAK